MNGFLFILLLVIGGLILFFKFWNWVFMDELERDINRAAKEIEKEEREKTRARWLVSRAYKPAQ